MFVDRLTVCFKMDLHWQRFGCVWKKYLLLCWCFIAPRHISGHFEYGQLTYQHCSLASLLGSLSVLSAHSFASNWQLLEGREWPQELFHDQTPWKNVAGREDRTRNRPHTRRTSIRSSYRARLVRNRVVEIKSHSGITFHFVSTKENPADIVTCGCSLQKMSKDELWWHGPQWLAKQRVECPESEFRLNKHTKSGYESKLKKSKQAKETNLSVGNTYEVIPSICAPFEIDCVKYSSVTKVLRVTAFVLLFIRRLR